MNVATLARRWLCASAALVLIACLGANGARAQGIQLFPQSHPHPAQTAKRKHKAKHKAKRRARHRRGPKGPAGPAGPQGPTGPAGAQGPAGPGAFKFGYYGKPAVNDPVHAVLPVGLFQLGVSCLPGAKTGEVAFKVQTTVPAALDYTQTIEALPPSGTQPPPEVTEGEEAATPPTPQVYDVASGKATETWASIMLTDPATGVSTWLELWYGAEATTTPVCYMTGIEI